MAWTAPIVWTNAVLTAAQMNQQVSGNMSETAAAKATTTSSVFVGAGPNQLVERFPGFDLYTGGGADTTTSGSYVSLSGGASVTSTTGTKCLVFHGSSLGNDTVGARTWCAYGVSGATSFTAVDSRGIAYDESGADRVVKTGVTYLQTGLISGSNTFEQQFRVTGGTGAYTVRHLGTIPL